MSILKKALYSAIIISLGLSATLTCSHNANASSDDGAYAVDTSTTPDTVQVELEVYDSRDGSGGGGDDIEWVITEKDQISVDWMNFCTDKHRREGNDFRFGVDLVDPEVGDDAFIFSYWLDDEKEKAEVREAVSKVVAKLQVPIPTVNTHPDNTTNKWGVVPVNLPVWFEASASPLSSTTLQTISTRKRISVRIKAVPTHTVWNTGDGTTISCQTSTPRPANSDPWTPSPDCGHIYRSPNPKTTITVSQYWKVNWWAHYKYGSLTLQSTATIQRNVGEIASVLLRNP